ncbi:nicotinate-nucleotide adenylyltransferase [Roseinatronobacter sp. HJB301]|uniref:Probable nicotinate-nucleotide adenylyltransferase n=1 Tax=Roseinatronobacter alkalisoli TaxID=3028235 RepID=A0ABT5T803_9RHOB|nr:nicotinate-nucleotide adenylyltransferase [Roseinatronobacter sp. HJB301]
MPIVARHVLPHAPTGTAVGLFGGSFDPAHDGHAHVTRHALRAFALDRLWWLVSPGNPLKANGPAPMAQRVARAEALMSHPRVDVTTAEAQLGTRYTADTLRRLMQLYPGRRFVWIMGADNLAGFHHWENWRWIMETVPVAVIARPGQQRRALSSVAARAYADRRVLPIRAQQLASMQAPAWCYITIPMRDISSTQLRAAGGWG